MTKPTLGQLKRFIGNSKVYAVQDSEGAWKPVREPLTPQVLRQHLEGIITVGTYIVKPPDQARTLVFDIDAPNGGIALLEAEGIEAILDALGLVHGLEYSGKKGYHVWVLASTFMDASTLYRLGRGIREEAGLPKVEVFPKQTEVRDLGNLVKLPGGIHRVTGKNNDFLESVPGANSVAVLEAASRKYPELGLRAGRGDASNSVGNIEYPCVHKIQQGVSEGGRNVQLFHLAVMLRRFSLTEENIFRVVAAANAESDPPLDDYELQQIVFNSQFSGPICGQLDAETNCGEQCVLERHPGLYTRAGALKWAADTEHVVVQVVSRTDDGKVLEIKHPDADQVRAVLKEVK